MPIIYKHFNWSYRDTENNDKLRGEKYELTFALKELNEWTTSFASFQKSDLYFLRLIMILHSFKSNLIVKVPVTLLFFNLFPTSFQNFSEFSLTEIVLNIRTFTFKNHNWIILYLTGDNNIYFIFNIILFYNDIFVKNYKIISYWYTLLGCFYKIPYF